MQNRLAGIVDMFAYAVRRTIFVSVYYATFPLPDYVRCDHTLFSNLPFCHLISDEDSEGERFENKAEMKELCAIK